MQSQRHLSMCLWICHLHQTNWNCNVKNNMTLGGVKIIKGLKINPRKICEITTSESTSTYIYERLNVIKTSIFPSWSILSINHNQHLSLCVCVCVHACMSKLTNSSRVYMKMGRIKNNQDDPEDKKKMPGLLLPNVIPCHKAIATKMVQCQYQNKNTSEFPWQLSQW